MKQLDGTEVSIIKWWQFLFLWLFPTQVIMDIHDNVLYEVYYKRIGKYLFLLDIKVKALRVGRRILNRKGE